MIDELFDPLPSYCACLPVCKSSGVSSLSSTDMNKMIDELFDAPISSPPLQSLLCPFLSGELLN